MKTSRFPGTFWLPVFFSAAMLNCADDGNVGDDEVGDGTDGNGDGDGDENPPPNPIDPLDGDGSVPPDSIDPTRSWSSPATLGNGLVHDSRRNLDSTSWSANVADGDLADGVAWSEFVGSYQALKGVGFRPTQLRAEVTAAPFGESTEIEIIDQSIYIADDDANYQTEIETYLFGSVFEERNFADFGPAGQGARPVSIDTFAVDGAGFEVGYSVAWVYDDAEMPWTILAGQSQASITTKIDEFANLGWRPISVASRQRGQIHEYAAILVQDGIQPEDWAVSLGLDSAALESEIQNRWQAGFHLLRGTAAHDDPSRLDLLWMRRPPGISVQVRMNLTSDTFTAQDAHWRTLGYHLESSDEYDEAGVVRRFAVWVRYEPYLRWHGTSFAPDDPAYVTRYRMFHDRVIRAMSFATEIDCSGGQPCPAGTSCYECPNDAPCFHEDVCVEPEFKRTLRPSGTLHVFEGEELVLSRAYTFAPATYPDTPLDTPMKLTGVSKSITAAALLREMDQQSINLATPFNSLVGIADAPPAMDAVTVLDVLRHLGGFTRFIDSYTDHHLIEESGMGTIPIDGKEMFDYAVAGHLGVEGSDSYWDNGIYEAGQVFGALEYSNVGYSMLGELVHVLSGVPYEQYVIDNLLAPLGLDQTVFGDPGHRVLQHGTTLAGLRAYLINADHPYHVKPEHQAVGQGNCADPFGWAWDGDDCTQVLGCQCVGPDCEHLYWSPEACEGDHLAPWFQAQSLPISPFGDESTIWSGNAGPLAPNVPEQASRGRYSGDYYSNGALLPSVGWQADGRSLGILIRAIAQSELLLPSSVSERLWSPQWWNREGSLAPNWSYGLGWYVRGNWVAWLGISEGSMAVVVHNRAHDFTVVHLANVLGNGLGEFMDPLMATEAEEWNTSPVGIAFPCLDDPDTPADECSALAPPFTVPY
jgi:CubicO group peptidase (beta-lactamase class C family)